MPLESLSIRNHQPIDHMSSGHLEPMAPPSFAEMRKGHDECINELKSLQSLPLPLTQQGMQQLGQLAEKSQKLQGHLDNMLLSQAGVLPGLSFEQSKAVFDGAKVFKQELGALTNRAMLADDQQKASQRQNQGRGNFQNQLNNTLKPTQIDTRSPQFGHQMQTELNRFAKVAEGFTKGYIRMSAKEMLETANMYGKFQGLAKQQGVELPHAQDQALQKFFAFHGDGAAQQLNALKPTQATPVPSSSPPTKQSVGRPLTNSQNSASASMESISTSRTDSSRKSTAHRIGSWMKRQVKSMGETRPPEQPMSEADKAQRDQIERATWKQHAENMKGVTIMTLEERDNQRREEMINSGTNPHARTGQGRG